MAMHESSVNYRNLIRDLAEMYPFDVPEVVVVELVANSLDAGATQISIDYDTHTNILVVADDGKGMSSSQFREYHDFAAGLKTRGAGIGFAGVGAKISFNTADRVITETRGRNFAGGSDWYLASKKRLVWRDVRPSFLQSTGTRVEVRFSTDTKPRYSNREKMMRLLKKHYLPLFDRDFLRLYERLGHYSGDLRFVVDGAPVEPCDISEDLKLRQVHRFFPSKAGKKIGYGLIGLAESEYPLGPALCGLLLCTRGKVVKADFFNQFPGSLGPRVLGVVEVPGFVDFLTTPKTDFIRVRTRHKEFERLYDPIRQKFKAWLIEQGIHSVEVTDTSEARRLERELKKLIDDVPELGEFFGFRSRKQILQESDEGSLAASMHEGEELTFPTGDGACQRQAGAEDVGDEPGTALVEDESTGTKKAEPISRTGRRGPKISFLSMPDRVDLAWVEGNQVVINSGHPSYLKTGSNNRARRIHCLFAIGAAVHRFVAGSELAKDEMFIDRLMAAWGKK